MPRTQVDRRNEAEHALLEASVRLFAARGIDQTSLADIGAAAGYSRGLVNHHFGTKAALVERLAERAQGAFVERVARNGGDELGALVCLAGAYLEEVSGAGEHSRAFFVMWGAALPYDSALRPVFVAGDARFRDGVAAVVRAGQKNGTVSGDVSPLGFAVALVGMLRGVAAQFLVDPGGVDVAATRAACEHFVRATLAPPSKPGTR
jgi:AcrR family transcriptional regulator